MSTLSGTHLQNNKRQECWSIHQTSMRNLADHKELAGKSNLSSDLRVGIMILPKAVTVYPRRTVDMPRELWKGKPGYYRSMTGSDRFLDRTCVCFHSGRERGSIPQDDPSSAQ